MNKNKEMGATAIEYALLVFLIGITLLIGISNTGQQVEKIFCKIASTLINTNGCDPVVNNFNMQINSLLSNLKKNEDNYVSAINNLKQVIETGKELRQKCDAGNETSCQQFNTYVNGSPTATQWSADATSEYNTAINAQQDALHQLTTDYNSDSTSLSKGLNDIFATATNSDSTYQQMIQKYGSDETNNGLKEVLSSQISDPSTGQKVSVSSLINSTSSNPGYVVNNNGEALISNFLNQNSVDVSNINWSNQN